MKKENDKQEEQTERRYKVREVTHAQASWTEGERGAPGKFTIQLILDNGVEEYILQPAADDIGALLKMLKTSNHATFDTERKVLMFNNIRVD
ncbi:MAG: hypothetical protein H0V27_03835 [Pyrinomonadaceae bacterium]|nr:hypothetical protein [Pyrinomonadaceae bacterium]